MSVGISIIRPTRGKERFAPKKGNHQPHAPSVVPWRRWRQLDSKLGGEPYSSLGFIYIYIYPLFLGYDVDPLLTNEVFAMETPVFPKKPWKSGHLE